MIRVVESDHALVVEVQDYGKGISIQAIGTHFARPNRNGVSRYARTHTAIGWDLEIRLTAP